MPTDHHNAAATGPRAIPLGDLWPGADRRSKSTGNGSCRCPAIMSRLASPRRAGIRPPSEFAERHSRECGEQCRRHRRAPDSRGNGTRQARRHERSGPPMGKCESHLQESITGRGEELGVQSRRARASAMRSSLAARVRHLVGGAHGRCRRLHHEHKTQALGQRSRRTGIGKEQRRWARNQPPQRATAVRATLERQPHGRVSRGPAPPSHQRASTNSVKRRRIPSRKEGRMRQIANRDGAGDPNGAVWMAGHSAAPGQLLPLAQRAPYAHSRCSSQRALRPSRRKGNAQATDAVEAHPREGYPNQSAPGSFAPASSPRQTPHRGAARQGEARWRNEGIPHRGSQSRHR